MQQDAITHDLQLKPHAPRLDEGRADYRNDYRLHSRLHTQPGQQQGTHTTRASNTQTKSKAHAPPSPSPLLTSRTIDPGPVPGSVTGKYIL